MPQPPSSTLFPYTALFRSSGANNTIREIGGVLGVAVLASVFSANGSFASPQAFVDGMVPAVWVGRSEEHTSELQSHVNLVCRLLLEKKINTSVAQLVEHWY